MVEVKNIEDIVDLIPNEINTILDGKIYFRRSDDKEVVVIASTDNMIIYKNLINGNKHHANSKYFKHCFYESLMAVIR